MSDRAEKLKQAGIKRFGSEAAWRANLAAGGKKGANSRTKPGGFYTIAKTNPELHKELSSRGGTKSKRGVASADQKIANSQDTAEGQT